MNCRSDLADGFVYRYCPNDPPRVADRLRAVARWLTIDEITQEAPEVDLAVTTGVAGLAPRVSRGGVMGLVGNPGRLFPGLDAATVQLPFSVAAPGFLPRNLQVLLGPIVGFPNAFTPADGGVVFMHRQPVALRGRVVRLTGLSPTPLVGANVRLEGVWTTFPPHNVDPDTVIEPPNLVSLHPGLYADRTQMMDGLRRRHLVLAAGEEKTLLVPAGVGDVSVRLNDSKNLSIGHVLAFETARPDRVEYVTVAAVDPGATNDGSATVTLTFPLRLPHEEGTLCARATPQLPAATNALTRDGIVGERLAFLSALSGLTNGVVVELLGGAAPVEYQIVRLYSTTSDANGFYRLPPLSRVASLKLHFDSNPLPPQSVSMSPDYRTYENFVDMIFP